MKSIYYLLIILLLSSNKLSGQNIKIYQPLDGILRDYLQYIDNLDYTKRLEESAIKSNIKLASPYFYGMNDETIFQDYVNYDAPLIKTPNKYFDELFTLFKVLNIKLGSRIFFDNSLPLIKSNFPEKYSSVIFKNDRKIKFGGIFASKKDFNFTRIGVIRSFSGTNSLDKSVSLNDTLFLYWIYKDGVSPRLILSTSKGDGKKFEAGYWLNEPSEEQIKQAKEKIKLMVTEFYESIDKLPLDPNLTKTISDQYLRSGNISIGSDLASDGSKVILKSDDYFKQISKLTKIQHTISDLSVGKNEREDSQFSFNVNYEIQNNYEDTAIIVNNIVPTQITVKADWKNNKFSNFKIETLEIAGTINSEVKPKLEPIAPSDNNAVSPDLKELKSVLNSKGHDLANSYVQFLKNVISDDKAGSAKSTVESLFFNPNTSIVQVSNYATHNINKYTASKYIRVLNNLSYDKLSFQCEIIESGNNIENKGKYWIGEIKIKQEFSGIYSSDPSNNYCDITNKILEIIFVKKDKGYALKIRNVRVIGKTTKDNECHSDEKK
ncbi:MAG: hypothetical protein ABI723_11895 [Bacteroidia bacterium]